MESNTNQRRKGLEEKVPELEQTLQVLALLEENKVCSSRLDTLPCLIKGRLSARRLMNRFRPRSS